jgi:hypothetical protein
MDQFNVEEIEEEVKIIVKDEISMTLQAQDDS